MSVAEIIRAHRDVPWGRIEFEQRPPNRAGFEYRAYHVVGLDGRRTRCVSVTTFLGALAKPALLDWREDMGAQGALEAERSGALAGVSVEDAADWLRANGMDAGTRAREAARRGVDVHEVLENYLSTGEAPNPADHPADHRGYIRGLVRWLLWAERHGLEVEATERLVAHPELRYAGRLDLRARLHGLSRVIDLKTNRHGRVWDDHHFQPVAYAVADEACGAEPVHDCLIVAVGPDGSFEQMRACSDPADFMAVLDMYRRLARLRADVKAERERLEAAA